MSFSYCFEMLRNAEAHVVAPKTHWSDHVGTFLAPLSQLVLFHLGGFRRDSRTMGLPAQTESEQLRTCLSHG